MNAREGLLESRASSRPYSIEVVKPGSKTAAAYPDAKGMPIIYDRESRVHRKSLRFLLDLAYSKWSFGDGFREGAGAKKPTSKSMLTFAENLCNFLDWSDRRSIDLIRCDYRTVERYEKEMSNGLWSLGGRPLADRTINARVDMAVFHLKWLADVGDRGVFRVATRAVTYSQGTHANTRSLINTAVVRAGRRRPRTKVLTLPTRPKVREWLNSAGREHGATFALMCRTVLRTALRREELACLRVDSLPHDPMQWEIVNPWRPDSLQEVVVHIEWGAKGSTLETCPLTGDERKVGRPIRIPMTLARDWHAYRDNERIAAVAKRLAGLKGRERERIAGSLVHLFLREDNGTRWTGKRIYDCWKAVPRDFADEWHPHRGRHWWACMVLFDEIQRLEADGRSKENILSIIQTRIQPQLGHLDKETTQLYLAWAMNQIGAPLVLDDDDQDTEEGGN